MSLCMQNTCLLSFWADLPVGEKKSLLEIAREVKDSKEYLNCSPEELKQLVLDLTEMRKKKKMTIRLSELSIEADARQTLDRLDEEVS